MFLVTFLDPAGQKRLDHLALEAALIVFPPLSLQIVGIARQLLGDRARPLSRLTSLPVQICRPHDADVVHAVVGIKPLVLAGVQGIDENFRHVGD